jgi:acetoin utilization protein AcuB
MTLFGSIRRSVRRRAALKQISKLRKMTVGEIMTKYVITIRADDDLIKAATKMVAEDISCLVVVDGDKAMGVITERDFLRKVPLTKAVFGMKVKDVMSTKLVTIAPNMPLVEAVTLMKDRGFRRLVVADGERMKGIVTQTDFTRTIAKVMSCYPVAPELLMEHIMTKQVLAVTSKNSVSEAKQKMLKADVGAIIIMEKGVALGIFTEYDVVMQFYNQHGKLEMSDIGKYMRKYVRAVTPQTSIFEANRLMLEKNMRRVLVVDGEKTIGIVTQTDICRYMYTSLAVVEKAMNDPKADLKRFSMSLEIHGEFHGEHLKVYSVE